MLGNSSTSSRQNAAFFLCDRMSTPTASRASCMLEHTTHTHTQVALMLSIQRRRACRRCGDSFEIQTIRLKSGPPEPWTMYGPRAANNVLSLFFHLQTAPVFNCREGPRADKCQQGRSLRTGSSALDRMRKRLDRADAWRLCKTFESSRMGRCNAS